MIALAALALAAPAAPASPAPAQPIAHHGHSMLGASDRAAEAELRAAEAHLIADLQGDDRLAWVKDYTEDAVFQEGSDEPVSGRAALTVRAHRVSASARAAIEAAGGTVKLIAMRQTPHARHTAGPAPTA